MHKALVLGTSFTAVPIIRRLQQRGFRVTTVGKFSDDQGHKISDAQIFEDYSNFDAVIARIKEQSFDTVVPTCNDTSYLSAAQIAQKLDIFFPDTLETISSLHNKENFKKVLQNLNIHTASRMTEENLTFPAFVKPTDAFSGNGCSIVYSKDKLKDAVELAKKNSVSGSCIIEEFVEGSLHSISTFIYPDETNWNHFVVDEFVSESGFSVVSSLFPSTLSKNVILEVIQSQKKIISDQKLTHGLLHSQFLVSKGKVFFVETMRRAPGDMFGEQIILGTSLDYWNKYIDGFVIKKEFSARKTERHNTLAVSRNIIGSLEDITNFHGLQITSHDAIFITDIVFYPLKVSGNTLNSLPGSKAGVVFIKHEIGSEPSLPNVNLL